MYNQQRRSNLYLLESLNLSHNKLPELQSSDFLQFPFLIHLDLSHNCLSALPETVATTTNLTYLNVGHNQIAALDDTFFSRLVNLVTFDASANPLAELPSSIGCATELSALDVRFAAILTKCLLTFVCQLRDTKLEAIPPLSASLSSFFVSGAQLGEPPESLGLLIFWNATCHIAASHQLGTLVAD